MTNVRVMQSFKDNEYVLDERATKKRKRRKSLNKAEIQEMLRKADLITNNDKKAERFFRLRAKAVVAIAKVFGKRRSEIATLEVEDLEVDEENNLLHAYFTLRKKRKRGLFQYLEFLKKKVANREMTQAEYDGKTQAQLEAEWRQWQNTSEGVRASEKESEKKLRLSSPYAKIILEYLTFIKTEYPDSQYLFPFGKMVFGEYMIDPTHHLGARNLLRIVKALNPDCWMHLFREMKGGDVAKKYGATLESVYKVQEALDLEQPETAHAYIKRAFREDEME